MLKKVVLNCGAKVLEALLNFEDGSSVGTRCECGGEYINKRRSTKALQTVFGGVNLDRKRQECNRCGKGRVPKDIALGVVGTSFSPGLRRMMAKTGAEVCFDKAAEFIFELAGQQVTDKEVERVAEAVGGDIAKGEEAGIEGVMQEESGSEGNAQAPCTLYIATDGTGVPMVSKETEGRAGKGEDGIARTREVKLGALFTQSILDEKGNPVRDPHSTTYVGKIETSESFGPRLYAEALSRGLRGAKRKVVIGDGAQWVWNLAAFYFPDAIQIVDYYHATEHLHTICKILFPENERKRSACTCILKGLLWEGDIPSILSRLRRLRAHGKKKIELEKELSYFEKNAHRMRYSTFRNQGLFIGSGVVEAGCKSLIGGRLKRSGMHWSLRGANDIIALKCSIESGRFNSYWESRLAA